ncbi:MAG TPA: hypothetical protein VEL31_10890, partial [Ktedonobacteraceae bacterium]|nr:hypothetical protein [Ktedonobacteraceae bacterium]
MGDAPVPTRKRGRCFHILWDTSGRRLTSGATTFLFTTSERVAYLPVKHADLQCFCKIVHSCQRGIPPPQPGEDDTAGTFPTQEEAGGMLWA